MRKSTLVIPPLAVLTLVSLAAADAPAPSPSRVVEMEIVDTPKQGPGHTAKFAMAVVEDRGWFANSASDSATNVHVSARIDHDRGTSVNILSVEVQRHGGGDLDVHGARTLDGKPTRSLMGRVERSDGVSEIFATVR